MTSFKTWREISAPIEHVFAAFSDPERLARWWGPAGFTNTFHVCEFESGGRWIYTMHSSNGGNPENESVFELVEPPRTIVIRHISQPLYLLTIDLIPTAAGTMLSWLQEFDDAEVARRIGKIVVPANEQNLDRLTAEVLQGPVGATRDRFYHGTKADLPLILVLTGASGAGKTTLIEKLNERAIPGVVGINCDRVKLDLPEGSNDRQTEVLRYWITKLAEEDPKVTLAVLDTQIRPHAALRVLDGYGIANSQVVLVNCDHAVRNKRLINDRKQPELANPQMDCWAAYLRGQADALGLAIIHTDDVPTSESFEQLHAIVSELLKKRGVS